MLSLTRNHRGQITIFIIVAIVIVVAGILFFIFREDIMTRFVSQEDKIVLFVENCVEDTGKDAIHSISENSGYFNLPEFSTSGGIPYYYSDGKSYMPSKEIIEEQISNYMNTLLGFCFNDFADFPEFEITEGETETQTRIKDEEIILNVRSLLTIKKEEGVTRFDKPIEVRIPVRLGLVYDSIEEIIQEQLTHEDICLSCVSDVAFENDLKIDLTNVEDGMIFTIIDGSSRIKDVALRFRFANRYKKE